MDKDERKRTTADWRVSKASLGLSTAVPRAMTILAHTPEAAEDVKALKAAAEKLQRSMAGLPAPANAQRQTKKDGWQVNRIKKLLSIAFPPDGRVPTNLKLKAIQARLAPVFEQNGLQEPSTDSIARAIGRRGNRG